MNTRELKFLILFLVGNFENSYAKQYDTIVVGMGAAGSAAASALAQAGKNVLGLEAQRYVGGRVKTYLSGNNVIELGAEWIHGTENSSVFDLAVNANINPIPQDTDLFVYNSDQSPVENKIFKELVRYSISLTDTRQDVAQPLGQFITRGLKQFLREKYPELLNDNDFLNGFLEMMDLIADVEWSSNNWNDVSTHSSYKQLGGHQHVSWHKYGYKTMFEILLNTYNSGSGYSNLKILLNKEVVHISWPSSPILPVMVKCRDGSIFFAKNVIITVSLGVLKERYSQLFTPNLPLKKSNAINHISYGTVGKIVVTFDKIWWPKDCFYIGFMWKTEDRLSVDQNDYWTTRIFGCTCPKASAKSLTLWTSGDVTKLVETLPLEEVITKIMKLLRRFINSNITDPISVLRSNWFSNPFTRGSYSYDGLLTPLYPNARVELGEPLLDSAGKPRVLFAGEATEPRHFSTVHGATDTGYREAMRLLQTQ